MNLFLLGATGNTGRHVVDRALAQGHRVTAFVRSPRKIDRRDVHVVTGSPLDVTAMTAALAGHDAVISTLGLPPREALRPSTFMAETGATTVAAMKNAGVSRLAILSAAVLFPGSGLGYRFFRWLLQHHARDLVAMETIVKASDTAWTIARPPRLVHSEDASYVEASDALPDAATTASYRGVARFLVDVVEGERQRRTVVGLALPRARAHRGVPLTE